MCTFQDIDGVLIIGATIRADQRRHEVPFSISKWFDHMLAGQKIT